MIMIAGHPIECVATKVVIEANMGPAQGVHNTPRATPKMIPLQNSEPVLVDFSCMKLPRCATFEVAISKKLPSLGISMVNPKNIMSTIAMNRRKSGDIPTAATIVVKVKVKNEKLAINPMIMP